MRVRAEQLFQTSEALRRRIEHLEAINNDLVQALRLANSEIVKLAQRVRRLEDALEAEGRDQFHQEGQEQGR